MTRVSKVIKSVKDLPTNDRLRLLQCVFCQRDSAICDCDETDEDEDGLCKKYQGTIVFEPQERSDKE
jgi:hypothetical protein